MKPVITWRTRASGPGWTPEQFKADFLLLAKGNVNKALDLACQALHLETLGGRHRPPPLSGPAEVKPDDVKVIE